MIRSCLSLIQKILKLKLIWKVPMNVSNYSSEIDSKEYEVKDDLKLTIEC
jgi:hypothetical protein